MQGATATSQINNKTVFALARSIGKPEKFDNAWKRFLPLWLQEVPSVVAFRTFQHALGSGISIIITIQA